MRTTYHVSVGYWQQDGGVLIIADQTPYFTEAAACRAARFAAFSAAWAGVDRRDPVDGSPGMTRETAVCHYARARNHGRVIRHPNPETV